MNIRILSLKEGAGQAEGLTVIIDVFRAFSFEAWLFHFGVKQIYPVADIETAFAYRQEDPAVLLAGERHGKILEGFDFGNAPSSLVGKNLQGRSIVHTTSAGTQGITAARNATEILGGTLVNARATAEYILRRKPETVSLVAMGWEGVRDTEEDLLCAEYIRSILNGQPLPEIQKKADDLRYSEGKKFFDPAQQEVFPQADFGMCTDCDRFPFVIRINRTSGQFTAAKVEEDG